DMVKIGRRGSINGVLTGLGTEGHSAYPHLADNPIPRLARMIHALADEPFDAGSEHFPPTTLAFTTVDVGNPATNVTPARATASFNIRFNDLHSADSLRGQIRARLDAVGGAYDLAMDCTAEVFLTPPGALTDMIADAAESVLGRRPELSTTGGTSDARFLKNYCPTAEFGLVGRSMHKVDECAAVEDLDALSQIYEAVLDRFFRD
ncbi:MAG: M20/M25/M40 family metallo-hydrolase, partial [Alphaproteobacteria bacterium]